VRDKLLAGTVRAAYGDLLPQGRYPMLALFLSLPPDEVDVNVHPTKAEVRFVDPQRLYRLVLSSIRRRFLGLNFESPLQPNSNRPSAGAPVLSPELPMFAVPAPSAPGTDPAAEERQRADFAAWAKSHLETQTPREGIEDLEAAAAALELRQIDSIAHERRDFEVAFDRPVPAMDVPPVGSRAVPAAPPAPPRPYEDAPRAMQVLDCYLVVEAGDAVTLIDQHALHERIMYEQLRRRVLEGRVEVQRLLMPVLAELTPREVGLLLDQTDILAELGLEVTSLGGRSVGISAYPVLLRRADPVELVRAVVEQIEQAGQKLMRRDLIDSLLHMMACKAAIKAGHRLAPEEIESLLAQRHLVDDAHHCPHGRPTALTLTRAELDRQFGRLG
jgi:DNA mismatch repair protein MutL